jgi:ElaB/YqjD/DUF883 family membrane-anchored ribosome-binding protein
VAKRGTRDSSLNSAAENIGTALGHVAARLDRWKKDQASISADLQSLLKSAQDVLGDLGGTAAKSFDQARKGGRPKGYKTSPATKAKLRAAWERRKASSTVMPTLQSINQPGLIRSKAPRTWSNRQPGKG